MKIAVLGGGNGSFAAAGDFALQGHDVRLWRRDAALVPRSSAEPRVDRVVAECAEAVADPEAERIAEAGGELPLPEGRWRLCVRPAGRVSR